VTTSPNSTLGSDSGSNSGSNSSSTPGGAPAPRQSIQRAISLQSMWMDLEFPDRTVAAAAAGFDLIDLWDWRLVDMDAVAAVARDHGIGINGFFGNRDFGLADPTTTTELMEALKRSIDTAVRVGAHQVHVFSNAIRPGGIVAPLPPVPSEVWHATAVEHLQAATELVAGTGICLMLEHMNTVYLPGYLWDDSAIVTSIAREINHPQVRMVYDGFHQQLTVGRLTDHLKAALPWMGRMDVGNVPGRAEPTNGEINYGFLRDVLDEGGWDGTITFEIVPSDGDPATACAGIDAVFPAEWTIHRSASYRTARGEN